MQFRQIAALAAALTVACGIARAQDFPSRPLRIVTQEAGGGNDNLARLIAAGIIPGLGQQIIVDNRGGTRIATEAVIKAAPDGYTMLSISGTMWILPLLQEIPYVPLRDLAPVSLTATSPAILVIHPDVPAKNVKELIAYAKSKPGQLNYAMSGAGSGAHLAAEMFKSMAGVDIVRINYKGGTAPLNDLVSGRVQIFFGAAATTISLVKSGKLRALAVTTAKPSEMVPGVPPLATEGVPGYEQSVSFGIYVPAKTPAAIIGRLNQEIVRALRAPGMKERFLKAGAELATSSPQEFAAYIRADQARMAKVIKDAGITAE